MLSASCWAKSFCKGIIAHCYGIPQTGGDAGMPQATREWRKVPVSRGKHCHSLFRVSTVAGEISPLHEKLAFRQPQNEIVFGVAPASWAKVVAAKEYP